MIDILNPQLDSTYADYWGEFLPFALESWWPIIQAACYIPRWFQAPTNALTQMTAGQYNEWSLQLPVGSFILEILHNAPITITPPISGGGPPNTTTQGTFTVQITDVSIDHKWFSNPMPDAIFWRIPSQTGRNGHVLPKPYPVISPGNFLIQRWCTVTGPCELIFACAVPQGN